MLHPELKLHLRSLTRVVYYITDEEDRAILDINNIFKEKTKTPGDNKVFVYNHTMGLLEADAYISNLRTRVLGGNTNQTPSDVFDKIYQEDAQGKKHFYIILDPDRWMAEPHLVRKMLNFIYQAKLEPRIVKSVIFVGSRLVMSQKLQQYIHVVRDTGLTEPEIQEVLDEVVGQMNDVALPPNCAPWFKGLNSYEVECAAAQSVVKTKKDPARPKRIDREVIGEYKRNRIQKSDLISIVSTDTTFSQVGGVDRFKAWVEEARFSWTKAGREYGLKPPKGVLAVGVWGCGKSLSIKALSNVWKLPLVQLELGRLRSSAVGSTEDAIYRVTAMLEALSPCIAWIDEAEKSLSGAHSSSYSDAGTTARVLGILSTWHQETKADVCLAMTANSLKTMPVEFINRIEDRFFFDIPSQDVRTDIIKIHLGKETPLTPKQISEFSLIELAKASDNLVPREMEQAVRAALRRSFAKDKPSLDYDILLDEFKTRPRILRTMDSELKEVLDWVGWDPEVNEGVRARFASSKQSTNTLSILKGGKK